MVTPDPAGKYFISATDAAAKLGISRATVYEMARRGHFETLRYGKRRLIFANSVDQVARQMVAGEAGPYPVNRRREQSS